MSETNAAPVYNPVSTSDNPGILYRKRFKFFQKSYWWLILLQDDKPPSYFNVLEQIRVARQDSSSPVDLTKRTLNIICGSCKLTFWKLGNLL